MNQIYTVKETAKILGFSTNTVYKYLNEGRLRSARGDLEQGRFRIPHQAIEEFLGTELPIDIVDHVREPEPEPQPQSINHSTPQQHASAISTPSSLPSNVAKVLILFSLLAIIGDIITAPTISLFGQIIRISLVGVFILLTYQHINTTRTATNE
ncbi:helix-turn-helix domain-containing protein [Patescibacteria group bacterium]